MASTNVGWVAALCALCVPLFASVVRSAYRRRIHIYRLRKAGLPMPQWSWWTGHLLAAKLYMDRHPPDVQANSVMADMGNMEFARSDMFYLDFWPFSPGNVLVVLDPEVATEVVSKLMLPKAHHFKRLMEPLAGGPNIFSMSDPEWKPWRALFNPGFSTGYLLQQVPRIVDSTAVFCDRLREKAGTGMFELEELTIRLALDVIIIATLDTDMDYQRTESRLPAAMRRQVAWHLFGNELNPLRRCNPIQPLVQRYYGWVMNRIIAKELQQRFEEMKLQTAQGTRNSSKSTLALALEGYSSMENRDVFKSRRLDPHFIDYATYQIRIMLFAGHDTTSSTLCWIFYLLAKHSEVLQRIRSEHEAVFGPDLSRAKNMLRENPSLVNKTPLTLAAIKETLRLFPPASSMRDGSPDVFLKDRNGRSYPTDGILIWLLHFGIHRNPRVWPRPDEFVPERWLVEPGHELYPPSGAFRPFEHGHRNCIGQALVYVELRIALIMTLRMFDIQPAYDELDAKRTTASGLQGLKRRLGLDNGVKNFRGERAYMVEIGGAHPADGYPCRVELLESQ